MIYIHIFLLLRKNIKLLNLFIILSFIILSFLSCILLLKNNVVYEGTDIQFHFKRIMELISSVKHGNLLPDFSFNQFHGSAVMITYPYFNLFPAVFLSFIIKSKIYLVYGYFIFNTLLTFIVSFYSSKNYIKKYSTSYIFAIIYGLSNIFLSYNLIITDLGIVYSFIFLPLIIFGFLKLIQGKKSWIELSLGMGLLAFSHLLNLFIISAFLLLWLIINIKGLNKNIIINLLKSIFLFLMLTSVLWLPFINLYIHNINNINIPFVGQLRRIGVKDFMSGVYGGKSNNTIGFFPIISLFISILFYSRFNRYIKQMYLLSLVIIISVLMLPLKLITSYGIFKLLNQIQFTYRFLIIPQMLLSFIFAVIVSEYVKSFNKKLILYSVIICIAIFLQIVVGQNAFINRSSKNLPLDEYLNRNNNVIYAFRLPDYKLNTSSLFDRLMDSYQDTNSDYIPKNAVSSSLYVSNNLGIYNNHHKVKINHIEYNTFNFKKKDNMKKLSLPLYLYKGEKLNVYLNNHQAKYYLSKEGLLTIYNIESQIKDDNKLYIKPASNNFRIIGAIFSIFSLLFVFIVIIKRIKIF